jgi:Protein of unknown function (DUF1572)
MMKKDLVNRLREVLLDGKWIANTNLKQEITSCHWESAIMSVEGLNSIASLTFHLHYYLSGVLNVFLGGNLEISDQFSFDMKSIDCEEEWLELVNDFLKSAELYICCVEDMDDERLSQTFVKHEYGNYWRNIEAQIEHSYYHLGQIVLIKKIIAQRNVSTEW